MKPIADCLICKGTGLVDGAFCNACLVRAAAWLTRSASGVVSVVGPPGAEQLVAAYGDPRELRAALERLRREAKNVLDNTGDSIATRRLEAPGNPPLVVRAPAAVDHVQQPDVTPGGQGRPRDETGPGHVPLANAHEAASADVLRIVHAFGDAGRKQAVRELAARVKRLEDAAYAVWKSAEMGTEESGADPSVHLVPTSLLRELSWVLGSAAATAPETPPKDIVSEIVAWLEGLEGCLERVIRGEVPAHTSERRDLQARRGIYEGIARDIQDKWGKR